MPGVVAVVTETSLIRPLVGLNVIALSGVLWGDKTGTNIRGVAPFRVADIPRLTEISLIPAIPLYPPQLLHRWSTSRRECQAAR